MKKLTFMILSIPIFVATIFISNAFTQEHTQLNLPEGAKARFGNGIFGITSLSFSPDGTTLASGFSDNTIRLWDVTTGEIIKTLHGHTSVVLSVAFSPDGNLLASGGYEDTVYLWDPDTGDNIGHLGGHTDAVTSVTFSPDGTTLASGSADDTVRLWDLATYKNIITLHGHTDGVLSVAFSPDGTTLASGSYDGTVRLWDVLTGEIINILQENLPSGYSVDFSPDGSILASGTTVGTIILWDVATGEYIDETSRQYQVLEHVNSVVFSPDGSTLASGGSYDGTVRLWPVLGYYGIEAIDAYIEAYGYDIDHLFDDTGQNTKTLRGHTDGVTSVAFSPNGTTLASGSWDGTILLWEMFAKPPEPVGPISIVVIADVDGIIGANPDGSYTVGGIVDASVPSPIVLFRTKLPAELKTYDSVNLVLTAADGTETVIDGVVHEGGEDDLLNIMIDVGTLENGTYMFHVLAVDESGDVLTDESSQVTLQVANFLTTDISDLAVIAVDGSAVSEPQTEPISVQESITVRFTVANDALAADELIVATEGIEVPSEITREGNAFTLMVEVEAWEEGVYATYVVVTKQNGSVDFPLLTINTDTTKDLQTDVNDDGIVNIQDLVTVAAAFGETGETPADVNGDGVVNIQDLVAIAAAFGETAANAPSATNLSTETVQQWLTQVQQQQLTDPTSLQGILLLEQLLAALTPKKTVLLPNYPNPFNPETWIPYQLAQPADVSISIYAANSTLVRALDLGHQPIGLYQSRNRAAHWDGKNDIGESVASGLYFYTLTAGDFSASRKMLILK